MAVTDPRQEAVDKAPARKPAVALALGAGGAKGLAHIGAIEELEAQGFEITAIAGCSMGALIGGIHAMGKLDIYRDWVCSLDKFDVLKLVDWSFSFSGGGLIKGEKLIGTLLDLIGDTLIEELPIAFTAVATDIEREREVWLTRGSLFDAVRASIAIPTLFRPHSIDGRVLVDGALLNPVPVTPLIRDPADYVIAVSIDGPADTNTPVQMSASATPARRGIGRLLGRLLPGDSKAAQTKVQEHGALELLVQSMDLMQANLSRLRLAAYQPDLQVQIARNVSSAYEFYRARELIELGRAKTRAALAEWNPGRSDA
ncbi:patatin-like phospholipase family protein [Dyella mobilis]|uniref:Patatin-like phospholipase family protein n=1 Tax=Dyella mobilis TaxID=1849582 RepID=A0ABS2KH92_9GAMM|nr:patatin-like phospholipase family protein [Dyella mobilis]MBM7129743.1 patatin-like phospholipase family protein [Dyella mobilis]GLQ97992.1 serine protease [Dyella mobilis]